MTKTFVLTVTSPGDFDAGYVRQELIAYTGALVEFTNKAKPVKVKCVVNAHPAPMLEAPEVNNGR